MRATISEGHVLVGTFPTGSTVLVDIVKLPENILVVSEGACTESLIPGVFFYQTALGPVAYAQYAFKMYADDCDDVVGVFDLGGYPELLDGIKERSDRLPDTPADEATLAAIILELDGILADSDELQQALAEGGRIESIIAAIREKTDLLKSAWNDLTAAEVRAEVDAGLAAYDAPTKAEMDAGLALIPTQGAGSKDKLYGPLIDSVSGLPIADAEITIYSDEAMSNRIAYARTNQNGYAGPFQLDPGTVYIRRSKTGYVFTNPDVEVVDE